MDKRRLFKRFSLHARGMQTTDAADATPAEGWGVHCMPPACNESGLFNRFGLRERACMPEACKDG